jgi:hypothetical protein
MNNSYVIRMLLTKPEAMPVPKNNAEYVELRSLRNKVRDQIAYLNSRGDVKHFDVALQGYEQLKGTDYCQKLWLGIQVDESPEEVLKQAIRGPILFTVNQGASVSKTTDIIYSAALKYAEEKVHEATKPIPVNPHEPIIVIDKDAAGNTIGINPLWIAWQKENIPDFIEDEAIITLEMDNTDYGIIENLAYDIDMLGIHDMDETVNFILSKYKVTRR